jgi:hypothetical protein
MSKNEENNKQNAMLFNVRHTYRFGAYGMLGNGQAIA